MEGFDVRRVLVWVVAIGVGIVSCMSLSHADTSTCGFLKCEQNLADFPGLPSVYKYKCAGCASDDNVCRWNKVIGPPEGEWEEQSEFPKCNCAAEPDIPHGTPVALNSSGNSCKAGCYYKPIAPAVCTGTPYAAGAVDPGGATCDTTLRPTGGNCDPLSPDEPDDPPTATKCTIADGNENCITPLVPPPPDLPEICGTRNGESLGCVTPPDCSKTPAGYLCAGSPPPTPPPATPPNNTPPPDTTSGPGPYCSGPGACSIITINIGGPDAPPPTTNCPPGTHADSSGNCVNNPQSQPCPNGHPAVNGQCQAPTGNCSDGTAPNAAGNCNAGFNDCPDGSHPVQGQCQPVDGHCSDGSEPVGGHCGATFHACPSGAPATQGQCAPPFQNCPNGSAPVNGMCNVGETCNPATDPNHCAGASDDNAGGGQTCGAPPFCSGDVIACAVLNQSWATRCAVEHLSGDHPPEPGDYGQTFTPGQAWGADDGDQSGSLNSSGWLGGGGSCPSLPSASFMGHTFAVNDWLPCSSLHILSLMILFGAYAQAAYILGRR